MYKFKIELELELVEVVDVNKAWPSWMLLLPKAWTIWWYCCSGVGNWNCCCSWSCCCVLKVLHPFIILLILKVQTRSKKVKDKLVVVVSERLVPITSKTFHLLFLDLRTLFQGESSKKSSFAFEIWTKRLQDHFSLH